MWMQKKKKNPFWKNKKIYICVTITDYIFNTISALLII